MDDEDLRREYVAMAARAGIAIPAERDAVMFAAFRSLRDLLSEVHKSYAYADEPAFTAPGRPA